MIKRSIWGFITNINSILVLQNDQKKQTQGGISV